MPSFSISYPDLIKISWLCRPLKEGIGGEREGGDFKDNSNVSKSLAIERPWKDNLATGWCLVFKSHQSLQLSLQIRVLCILANPSWNVLNPSCNMAKSIFCSNKLFTQGCDFLVWWASSWPLCHVNLQVWGPYIGVCTEDNGQGAAILFTWRILSHL
jgi:hypothetical protein